MKALIFGDKGFVGPHLEDRLRELELDVYGFDIKNGDDIRDYEQVRTAIDFYQPDYIFNLAGMAYVGEAQLDPQRAIDIHVKGTLNILDAVRNMGLRPKILLASTAEEYGYEHQLKEVTEESPTYPTTIYGATKNAMTNIARTYIHHYGMHIIITRAFNHIGRGQAQWPVTAAWAKQIVEIERGERDILRHGNLETIRNFTDVRDIVDAYARVISAEPGVYNICSPESLGMDMVLDELVAQANVPIKIEVDERLYRPGDTSFMPPSAEKIRHAIGWKPKIAFDNSIKDVLDDWRERLM